METFYLIVLTIAIVLLIIILTYIGLYGLRPDTQPAFPPVKYDCPDYWKKDAATGGCVIPGTGEPNLGNIGNTNSDFQVSNTNTLGYNSTANVIDFEDAGWSANGSARCEQKKWAIEAGVVWDTVTNYNQC